MAKRYGARNSRVGLPMTADDQKPRSMTGSDGVVWDKRVPPPLDEVVCFNTMLKLIKSLQLSRMRQQCVMYEEIACDLRELISTWFTDERGANMPTLSCDDESDQHRTCPAPVFPTLNMRRVVEHNHILQSHLVMRDPCVVVVDDALRSAMAASDDFVVVLGMVVDDMERRMSCVREGFGALGYAYEPVCATFCNFTVPPFEIHWRVQFPARKLAAAFFALKSQWHVLHHVPFFPSEAAGAIALSTARHQYQKHTLSPTLSFLL